MPWANVTPPPSRPLNEAKLDRGAPSKPAHWLRPPIRRSKQALLPAAAGLSNKLVMRNCVRTPLNCADAVAAHPNERVHANTMWRYIDFFIGSRRRAP